MTLLSLYKCIKFIFCLGWKHVDFSKSRFYFHVEVHKQPYKNFVKIPVSKYFRKRDGNQWNILEVGAGESGVGFGVGRSRLFGGGVGVGFRSPDSDSLPLSYIAFI